MPDNIGTLIDQAHQIFNQTSVFEVVDMATWTVAKRVVAKFKR